VEFRLGSYSVKKVKLDGKEYVLITAPGTFPSGEEGAPALPSEAAVLGVPHGASVSVRLVEEDVEWLGEMTPIPWPTERIDDRGTTPRAVARLVAGERFYSGAAEYPGRSVEVREAGVLRGLRLVSVVFHPFKYIASRGGVELRRRIVVSVSFSGGRRGTARPPASGDMRWEPVLRSLVLNYSQARAWAAPRVGRSVQGGAPGLDVPRFKLKIRESALYEVRYDELASLGTISPVDTSLVRLYERIYSASLGRSVERDFPVFMDDADGDGLFGPGDSFLFYGQSYWDRFPEKRGEGARTRPHVYWVSLGEPGVTMQRVPAWAEGPFFVTPTSFHERRHLEKDAVMNRAPSDEKVFLFWLHPAIQDERVPFEVPWPDSGAGYGVRVRFQPADPALHSFSLFVSSAGGTDTLAIDGRFSAASYLPSGKPPYTYYTGIRGRKGFLTAGQDTLRILGRRFSNGEWLPGLGAYLDWFEVEYERLYRAWNDTITCKVGPSAEPVELRISGFSSPRILAFDVTDPEAPKAFSLKDRNVSPDGAGGFSLLLRGGFGERRRIAAAEASSVVRVQPPQIERDVPSDLRSEGNGADYLVIAYDPFAEELQPLVALRESQGFKVALAKASDVYDEFGDGYKSDEAVKNYLKYAYDNWGSAYALLVGDANEDREGLLRGPRGTPSPPDFIPSHLYLHNEVANAPAGPELVNADAWYGVWLDGVRGDWLPDMFVGRLPAGSKEELRGMVEKIVRYEDFGSDDQWRSRGLFVADDSYSSSIFFNAQYCFQSAEAGVFEPVCDKAAEELEDEERGVPDFSAPVFRLDNYLGAYPDSLKKTCYGGFEIFDIQDYTRAHVTPVFVDTLSLGWLFVCYQGHGNENVWTHETLFASYPSLGGLDDVASLGNTDRPFILYAFSCHISDFDDFTEGETGDCMGERMLLLPHAGALAVYASAGYEYISSGWYNVPLMEALLTDPPTEEQNGQAYIRLGPAIAKGGLKYALTASPSARSVLATFNLLGDPATRVDAAAPRVIASVADSVLHDGDTISDPSGNGELEIRYEIRDEVAIDTSSVFVREVWHRYVGQDSTYEAPRSETPISASADGRRVEMQYTVRLLPASMELVAGARDRNGRLRTITLRAVFAAAWRAGGKPISSGEIVSPHTSFSVRISSPVAVEGASLALALDGRRISSGEKRRLDSFGTEWELSTGELSLEDGSHELAVLVDGRPASKIEVRVDTRFRFASVLPYPNPCDERGTTIYYEISSTGETEIAEVSLKIYTVSGRLVAVLRDPSPGVGRGSLHWDCRDEAGRPVGNGVYLCKATAVGGNGRRVSAVVKLAVAR